MSIYFSHSANKITTSFEIDSLIGLFDQLCFYQQLLQSIFVPFFSFHLCLLLLILYLSLYCLSSFLIIDSQASMHPWLAFVADLSNNDYLIPDKGTRSVEAVAVAAPAGNWICTDNSHLNPPKGKFCETSADWQNLGSQSWWQRSNIKTNYYKLISLLWILQVTDTASLPMHFQTGKFSYTQFFCLN